MSLELKQNGTAKDNPAILKMNYKRTTLIGLAFLAIQMFWNVYDSYMPLFLQDFNLGETMIGLIMALDNILALALLPFIGFVSDNFPKRLRDKYGRRVPFIVIGSVLASIIFVVVNIAHINRNLGLMISMTVLLLLFMNLYRTPAVSLMPDITPKRVRSGANAIVNVMGAVGMTVALVISMLTIKTVGVTTEGESGESAPLLNRYGMQIKALDPAENNWVIIGAVCAVLIVVALIFAFFVKENKFVKDKNDKLKDLGLDVEETDNNKTRVKFKEVVNSLSRRQKTSLLFILLSVTLWYFAYNAISTWFSTYWFQIIGEGNWQTPILIGNAAAFAMFVPATVIGKRIGRKNTILVGVAMMIGAFGLGTIIQFSAPPSILSYAMYVIFAFVGAGWAMINVHSFVMSVELASGNTNGVFTGLYYAFAMGAQALTPIISGSIIEAFGGSDGFIILFPYAFIFSFFAFITMLPVKHGNAKDKPIDDY